jgi:hypothetical protein
MADLMFSSFAQPPIGRAALQSDEDGVLGPAEFRPGLTLVRPDGMTRPLAGPALTMLGPGAVTGLDPRAVVRTDPPAGAGSVEPNYLASVELQPVELPWLLTPARPGARGHLRPWLVLVVVAARPGLLRPGRPLPQLTVDVDELPDLADSWGWAHVQQPAPGAVGAAGLPPVIGQAVARLVCPRRLAPSQRWLACVVPAFADGVAAGCGLPVVPGTEHAPAWQVGAGDSAVLPVLYSWEFGTGVDGDFETLIRRLAPLSVSRLTGLGVAMVDIATPWSQEPPLAGTAGPATVPVSGALRSFRPLPAGTADGLAEVDFALRLEEQLNAPAARLSASAGDGQPLDPPDPDRDSTGAVAPPIYGGPHRGQDTVHPPDDVAPVPDWLAELNFSVAARVAAGLGAGYVRANQEELMARAWEQVGEVREGNRRRRIGELTAAVAASVHRRHISMLDPGEAVAVAAPAAARLQIAAGGATLATEVVASTLADAVATSAFARLLRPGGPLARRAGSRAATVVARGLAGEVAVPMPRPLVARMPAATAVGTPDGLGRAVVSAVDSGQAGVAAQRLVALQAVADVARSNGFPAQANALDGQLASVAVDTALLRGGRQAALRLALARRLPAVAQAVAGAVAMFEAGGAGAGGRRVTAAGLQVDPGGLRDRLIAALEPSVRITQRVAATVSVPATIGSPQSLDPVYVYPQFPVPAALTLLHSAPEWFLPGIADIPPDTATLLLPDPAFIESYLVGLATELNRELRWREYPTDLRGTPFTRFWPRPDGAPDIPPIHTWTGGLGSHLDQRGTGQGVQVVVLLVRGAVVRRFPDLVVAAARALPPPAGSTRPVPDADPARWIPPLFVIPVDEQTAAYAFPIDPREVGLPPSAQQPGWFFAFAEHGYRLRFGFDDPTPVPPDGPPDSPEPFISWDRLDWSRVPTPRGFALAGGELAPPPGLGPDDPRWARDSADIARIALQRPFRVFVHAQRLVGGAR